MGRMSKEDRMREVEESDDVVTEKCVTLANLLKESKCTLVYTGAGISTAASIPDYRGPNGVWTLAERGIAVSKCGDPIQSSPTTSHMVLKELCRHGIVRHILSQNCDGLHLRSGIPQKMLSEIHGNMHIEVCQNCNPPRQFVRAFDVTKNSQFRRHRTGRSCAICNGSLVDTIVHFGEVGKTPWPLNWKGVLSLIDQCDLILCIGTSLAVLKQYHFLWPKTANTRIAIINLQWTPKDRVACLKINAKCDTVLEKLSKIMDLPDNYYCRECDPVLNPRRSTRINELMEKLTDCKCHLRMPRRSVLEEREPPSVPGWWSVGIQKTIKRSGAHLKRKVARTRQRRGHPRDEESTDLNIKRSRLDEKSVMSEVGRMASKVDDYGVGMQTSSDTPLPYSDRALIAMSDLRETGFLNSVLPDFGVNSLAVDEFSQIESVAKSCSREQLKIDSPLRSIPGCNFHLEKWIDCNSRSETCSYGISNECDVQVYGHGCSDQISLTVNTQHSSHGEMCENGEIFMLVSELISECCDAL